MLLYCIFSHYSLLNSYLLGIKKYDLSIQYVPRKFVCGMWYLHVKDLKLK